MKKKLLTHRRTSIKKSRKKDKKNNSMKSNYYKHIYNYQSRHINGNFDSIEQSATNNNGNICGQIITSDNDRINIQKMNKKELNNILKNNIFGDYDLLNF